ncbi:MAG: hypothetical protein KJO30_01615, partial [Boseongicola sp.]|nr:hypothetical protein [Boseongicola sp.]
VDNAYSRLVLWLKVALPLVALAILSTLFLVAETMDPEAAIPFAEVDVDQILRDQGITAPSFGTVTEDGAAVSLRAAALRPGDSLRDEVIGTGLEANIELPGGTTIRITSPEGTIDMAAEVALLQGGARFESSNGYSVESMDIVARYNEVRVATGGAVTATGPGGDITAGTMGLERDPETGAYVLVFKDGVRLIYDPQP